jgi:hypothetical protein
MRTALKRTAVCRNLSSDEGSAMLVVVAAMTILFILSTMLVTMSVFNVTSAQREERRVRALHIADAGLNAYLAGLRHDGPSYAVNYPTLGPLATPDGTWTASIAASGNAYVVRSTGTVTDARGVSSTRVLVSRVAYPTYADYSIMADDDVDIGADAVFIGKIGSTRSIVNSGLVFADSIGGAAGELWAGTTITTNSGSKPLKTNVLEAPMVHANQNTAPGNSNPWVDFGQITGDMTILQTTAAGSGTSYANLTAPTGVIGYQVVLNGGTYSLNAVKGNKFTGGLTYTAIAGSQNLAIPSAGVLYFDDDVWVKGTYNAALTIVSSGDIMLIQNIGPTNPASTFTCGLVAQDNVWIPNNYSTTELPTNITIQAALMAIGDGTAANGHCGLYPWDIYRGGGNTPPGYYGPLRGTATFIGSRTYQQTTGMVWTNPSDFAGFTEREYDYDTRLDVFAPPKFPVIHNGELKVTTWQEQ